MQAIRFLPLVFLFAGAAVSLDQFFHTRANQYSAARNVVSESIGTTRARLVNGLWQVLTDEKIVQNVEWNNWNSVTQTLQNHLRPGEVSQLEFLDESCGLIARVPSAAKPLPSGCRVGESDALDRPVLRWQSDGQETPVLSLAVPWVLGGRRVTAVGHVALDQGWISAHSELSGLVNRGKFSLLEQSPNGMLWSDGRAADGTTLVTLRVGGWIGRFLPDLRNYSLTWHAKSLWWVYAICGALVAIIMFQYGVDIKAQNHAKQEFLTWLKKYSDHGAPAPEVNVNSSWRQIFAAAEKKVEVLLDQKQVQWRMMRERQDQLTLAAIQREKQISELQEKLASMSDLASLKEQLQHSTSSFLKKMKDVRELCENMFDLSSEGLAKQGKQLHELVGRWKAGINDQSHRERGARKFLRTLSETPGKAPGVTKLDEELDTLGELTGSALDQSLHLAMLSRQALAELESGVQVAALWLGLSMRDSERDRTCDWVECLMAAQQLVGAELRYSTLSFERLPQVSSPEETYPFVARVALVSGFFHLYMALLADVTVEAVSLPIVLRQKRFSDKGTMILSLPHLAQDVADGAPGRGQGYHMELAKAILAPLGIRAAFLPPTIAGVPVAVTWPLPGKQVDVSPKRESSEKKRFDAEV